MIACAALVNDWLQHCLEDLDVVCICIKSVVQAGKVMQRGEVDERLSVVSGPPPPHQHTTART